MNKIVTFILFFIFYSNCFGQPYDLKIDVARYYVAFYDLKIYLDYTERIARYNEAENVLEHIFLKKSDEPLVDYIFTKYSRRFLGYDVFLARRTGSHTPFFKLGIDDSNRLIKLSGFNENVHLYGDTSTFLSYNDKVTFPLSYFQNQPDSVNNLIEDYLRLVIYSGHPKGLELTENIFTLNGKNIEGECTFDEVENAAYKSYKVFKKLKYSIVNGQFNKLIESEIKREQL